MNPAQPDTITHSVLGKLRWEAQHGWWLAQVREASGGFDVIVKPGGDDRFGCLDAAADLYSRALRAERQLLRTAVDLYLLELYNEGWRDSAGVDETDLAAEEFIARLGFDGITISPNSRHAINLGYTVADDMFGGHMVDVACDRRLNYIRASLVG